VACRTNEHQQLHDNEDSSKQVRQRLVDIAELPLCKSMLHKTSGTKGGCVGAPLAIKKQSTGAHCRPATASIPWPTHERTPSLLTAFLIAVFCLHLSSIEAGAATNAWVRQRTGTMAWLHSVFFIDQNRGWAVGSKGTLLSTDDGGNNWLVKSRPTEDVVRDIYFMDEFNGWLVCERNLYDLKTKTEPRTYLMTTADGGIQWERVMMKEVDTDARLSRAVFSRGGHGWAFGEGGSIYTTRDSGLSWNRLSVPTRYLLLGGTFIDNDRGWLVGAGATILQTSDGGDTWHVSRLTDAEGVRFTSASFVDNRVGWAVGTGGAVYRTVNGGRTWQAQHSGAAVDLLDVKFLNALEGWAVGAEGTVIHTTDGGLHWTLEPTPTTHSLERVFFTDRTHGWAVGFGGTVIAYGSAEGPVLKR